MGSADYGTKFCVFVSFIFIVQTNTLNTIENDITFPEWVPAEEFCRTPDRVPGNCTIVKNCKPIMDILDIVSKPLSQKVINILKSYQCGFSGRDPKVCCPDKPILIEGITGNSAKVPKEPPNVSNHKNIGLLPKQCGLLDTGDKIINGNKTKLFEFPWMALLSYRTNRGPQFKCGATILNERYILTAAHCITNLNSPLLGVRVGEHNIQTPIDCETSLDGVEICALPHQDLAIEEIIPHPEYNPKLYTNDIGILRVTKMNIQQEHVRPVCLPLDRSRNYNFTGRNCVVTGWGVTETGQASPILLKVQIPVLSNEQCAQTYKNVANITNQQLCAGGTAIGDSCAGDSGGPLQAVDFLYGDVRLIQQGIVSFGPRDCGKLGLPGVYTRVAYYMDWILDNMRS